MKKLPVLAAAAGAAALFAAGDAHAQLPMTNCQECVPRNNGDPGMMCWSGGGDLGACWEREVYDADGNVLYTYCQGSPCGTAE